jgi:hypothetical protein
MEIYLAVFAFFARDKIFSFLFGEIQKIWLEFWSAGKATRIQSM